MPTITEQILHDLADLPIEMQAETLDFVQFLKARAQRENTTTSQQKSKAQRQHMADILERMAKRYALADIKDAAAWQREIRIDRHLPDREA